MATAGMEKRKRAESRSLVLSSNSFLRWEITVYEAEKERKKEKEGKGRAEDEGKKRRADCLFHYAWLIRGLDITHGRTKITVLESRAAG